MNHRARLIAKAGLFVAVAALSGCSRKSSHHSAAPGVDAAQTEVGMSMGTAHRASLMQDLRVSLQGAFRKGLEQNGGDLGSNALLLNATAFAAADATAQRMADPARSPKCHFDILKLNGNDWLKCVVKEALSEDLSNATGLRNAVRNIIKEENREILGDLAVLRKETDDARAQTLSALSDALAATGTVETVVRSLEAKVDELRDILSILRDGVAINDVPWLAQDFFEGRRFVLTSGLQQASVGTQRAWNFDALIVRLELNAGRMFLIREKEGAYDGENGQDIILGSYPVVATRKADGQTYYQVNFAAPQNKRYMLPHFFGYEADPAVDFTAESVRIHVAHALKEPKAELGGSGLYFGKDDASLVLDQLVLMQGTGTLDGDAVGGANPLTPSAALKKDWLRPTVRFTQALIAETKQDQEFEASKASDLKTVSDTLFRELGVQDLGQGADYPYFSSALNVVPGKKVESAYQVRAQKFNLNKDVTFVISENTPAVMVAPIKSAVNSYANLFTKMAPNGQPAAHIRALTQAEFEEENRTSGLKIGGSVNAADPRVNMIFWEDVPGFAAAWGTSTTNPITGEIISGDIMLSGTAWAKAGCQEFMLRRWAAKPRAGEKPAPFPHPVTYALYNMACNMTLLGMRVVGPAAASEVPVDGPVNPQKVLEATERGDSEALKSMYLEAIKAPAALSAAEPNLARLDGESPVDYGTRIAAWYGARKDELRKLSGRNGAELGNLKGAISQFRAEAHEQLHGKHSGLPMLELAQGANRFRTALTCDHTAEDIGQNLFMANAGVPGISPEILTDAKQAAMAMVRIVAVHELGHIFGLRHNFVGSTTPSALEDGVTPAVPVSTRTDSIMDYNDAGVELEMGAMSDYTDPNGGANSRSFGIYELVALANLYGLDASTLKFKAPLKFCSDAGTNLLANCLPFDFGRNTFEHTLYQANLALQEMRTVKDTDFSNPFVTNDLNNRLSYVGAMFRRNMTNLMAIWGILAQQAHYTKAFDQQALLMKYLDQAFYARGTTEPFLSDEYFFNKTGMKPIGIWDAFHMTGEAMNLDPEKPQLMADIGAENIRHYTTMALLGVIDDVNGMAAEYSEDARYLKGIPDLRPLANQSSTDYLFRTMLIEYFAKKMLLPANTPVTSWVYLDGDRRPGSQARDVNGNPITLSFDKPMFNHTATVLTKKGLKISDGNGGEKEVIAIANGTYDLREMIFAQLALSQVAPWGGAAGGSPAFERQQADRNALQQLLAEGSVSQNAIPGAKFMVSAVDWMQATGFQPFGQ